MQVTRNDGKVLNVSRKAFDLFLKGLGIFEATKELTDAIKGNDGDGEPGEAKEGLKGTKPRGLANVHSGSRGEGQTPKDRGEGQTPKSSDGEATENDGEGSSKKVGKSDAGKSGKTSKG